MSQLIDSEVNSNVLIYGQLERAARGASSKSMILMASRRKAKSKRENQLPKPGDPLPRGELRQSSTGPRQAFQTNTQLPVSPISQPYFSPFLLQIGLVVLFRFPDALGPLHPLHLPLNFREVDLHRLLRCLLPLVWVHELTHGLLPIRWKTWGCLTKDTCNLAAGRSTLQVDGAKNER